MRYKTSGRPTTKCIHNEMNGPINKTKKCSYCKNEGYNKNNCQHPQ